MTVPTVEATQIHNQSSTAETTGAITITGLGLVEGDYVFAFCALDGTGGNPASVGYTPIQNGDEGNVECECLFKRMGATPDTTITITWTGTQQGRFMIVRIAGALDNSGDPMDATGTTFTGVSTFALPVSPASTVVDTLFLSFVAVDRDRVDGADTVTGTGWTEVGTSGSSGGAQGAGLIVGELDQASIGTPANASFGTWSADQSVAYTFNIKSPAGFAHSQGYIF